MFCNCSSPFSEPKIKTNWPSPCRAFSDRKFLERVVLVDCNLFFILVLKIGRSSKNSTLQKSCPCSPFRGCLLNELLLFSTKLNPGCRVAPTASPPLAILPPVVPGETDRVQVFVLTLALTSPSLTTILTHCETLEVFKQLLVGIVGGQGARRWDR